MNFRAIDVGFGRILILHESATDRGRRQRADGSRVRQIHRVFVHARSDADELG